MLLNPHRPVLLLPIIFFISGMMWGTLMAQDEVTLTTSDDITVYGDLYPGEEKSAPFILLFHQGASNARAEYETIIPVLLEQGYALLAIDQRRGGSRLGGQNRTVEQLGDAEYEYCDVYPDLEAALEYVEEAGYTGRRIAWGSSYSATLAIQLASKHGEELDGVLAFSPASGDPMQGCRPDQYLESLSVPLLILRPGREMEIESVQKQFSLFKNAGHRTYIAENGVHGSSMLNPNRVDGSVEPHWEKVLAFLKHILANPR